jgi:AraC-like DNA-binding protein
MPAEASDFQKVYLSTDAAPERERVALLCDLYGPVVTRLDMQPVPGAPLRFDMVGRVAPDLAIADCTGSSIRTRRTPKLIADGDDGVCLAISPVAGHQTIHLGREWLSEAGTGVLFSLSDPLECITCEGLSRVYNITVPRKVLAPMVPALEDRFMRPIPRETEALKLLTRYIEVLLRQDQELVAPELRRAAITHVHDLLAVSLGASRDIAEIANGRGLRAARLEAIKADILRTLGDPALSLTDLAARHRITPRYVQALFEPEGMTFSRFLLSQRLACVHRMLRDPAQAGRSISAIAYDAGFGDLSHFNRDFRRHYGATPSDVRAASPSPLRPTAG